MEGEDWAPSALTADEIQGATEAANLMDMGEPNYLETAGIEPERLQATTLELELTGARPPATGRQTEVGLHEGQQGRPAATAARPEHTYHHLDGSHAPYVAHWHAAHLPAWQGHVQLPQEPQHPQQLHQVHPHHPQQHQWHGTQQPYPQPHHLQWSQGHQLHQQGRHHLLQQPHQHQGLPQQQEGHAPQPRKSDCVHHQAIRPKLSMSTQTQSPKPTVPEPLARSGGTDTGAAKSTTTKREIVIEKLEFWEQDHAKAWEAPPAPTGPRARALTRQGDTKSRSLKHRAQWTSGKSSTGGGGPTGTATTRVATRATGTPTDQSTTPSTFMLTAGPAGLWLRTRTTAEGLFLETCKSAVEPTIVTLYQTPLASRRHARAAATVVAQASETSGQLSNVESRVIQALIQRALGGPLTRREINLLAQVRAIE